MWCGLSTSSRSPWICTGPPVYVARKSFITNMLWTSFARWARFCGRTGGGAERRPGDFQRAWGGSRSAAGSRTRSLEVIDATCPLVTKVHLEAVRFARDGYSIVLIGHSHHDEVIGTLGEAPESHLSGRVGRRCRPAATADPAASAI